MAALVGNQPHSSNPELTRIEAGFDALSRELTAPFHQSTTTLSRLLASDQLFTWAADCLAIAESALPESIGAATECFRATSDVADILDAARFLRWVQRGKALCRDTPDLAIAYFRVSPRVLALLPQAMNDVWLEIGPDLYHREPKSIALASRFITAMPDLLPLLSLVEMERLALLLNRLEETSHDLAIQCLASADSAFDGLADGLPDVFLSVALNLVRLNAIAAADFFREGARTLSSLDGRRQKEFLGLVEAVAHDNARNALLLLAVGQAAFESIEVNLHSRLIDRARILTASPPALIAFLQNCPMVVAEVGATGLERWATEGIRRFRDDQAAGLAYLRIGASDPSDLTRLLTRASLDDVGTVLLLYAQALAGDEVQVHSTDDLPPWSLGMIQPGTTTTDNATIFLPPFVDRYSSEEVNFAWYKVAVTHQASHVEFGSFRFSFGNSPAVFPRRLPHSPLAENDFLSDLERLIGLFADRELAVDFFSLAEDVRVDCLIEREYLGIRDSYRHFQLESLPRRPLVENLPLRQALVEALVQESLGGAATGLPAGLHDRLRAAQVTLQQLRSPEATVEDSAEATLRLYEIASAVPNLTVEEVQQKTGVGKNGDEETYPHEVLNRGVAPVTPGEEVEYRSATADEFRGELLETLRRLETEMVEGSGAEAAPPASPSDDKVRLQEVVDGEHSASGLFVTDLPIGVPGESVAVEGDPHRSSDGIRGGPVSPGSPKDGRSFLYDEWDYEDHRYLRDWCRVIEKPLAEGSTRFFKDTLLQNDALATRVKKQLEALAVDLRRRVNRLSDGEGLDIDAVVAAVVDRKTGHLPDARVYWERRKTHRDVAVVLLLDMSASTDDVVGGADTHQQYPEWYLDMVWDKATWQERRNDIHSPGERRVIDVVRESLVLMTNALEAIGDIYGIYGFSGHGRENVELLVVKSIDERFSDQVKGRIETISPRHGTRMGPAIRHVTTKLNACDAKTKILFMISDGYPQDRDYGRHGNDKEYALQDTRMAFVEARRKDIVPFCLTVDVAGHDYLRRMAGDMGYEVVNDVEALSERLPALYSRLTS